MGNEIRDGGAAAAAASEAEAETLVPALTKRDATAIGREKRWLQDGDGARAMAISPRCRRPPPRISLSLSTIVHAQQLFGSTNCSLNIVYKGLDMSHSQENINSHSLFFLGTMGSCTMILSAKFSIDILQCGSV
jgi:hypothetical protein